MADPLTGTGSGTQDSVIDLTEGDSPNPDPIPDAREQDPDSPEVISIDSSDDEEPHDAEESPKDEETKSALKRSIYDHSIGSDRRLLWSQNELSHKETSVFFQHHDQAKPSEEVSRQEEGTQADAQLDEFRQEGPDLSVVARFPQTKSTVVSLAADKDDCGGPASDSHNESHGPKQMENARETVVDEIENDAEALVDRDVTCNEGAEGIDQRGAEMPTQSMERIEEAEGPILPSASRLASDVLPSEAAEDLHARSVQDNDSHKDLRERLVEGLREKHLQVADGTLKPDGALVAMESRKEAMDPVQTGTTAETSN